MGPITTSIVGCARCHGDGHKDLEFTPLDHPVPPREGSEGVPMTHWAPCPTNGQPILLATLPKPTTSPEG